LCIYRKETHGLIITLARLDLLRAIYRHFIFRNFIFWIILFAFMRLLFVVTNISFLEGSLWHKITLFFAALRLDAAMSAYLTAPIILLWLVYVFAQRQWIIKTARILTKIFCIPVIIISLINMGNYANWGTVINKRVLLYFENPSEVTHFMSTWQLVLSPLLIIGICWLVIWFYGRFTKHFAPVSRKPVYLTINFLLLPICGLLMRGGWQTIPISESAAYYSAYNPNNHAAINPVFYFIHDVSGYYAVDQNKYHFFNRGEDKELFAELMRETGPDTIQLTNVQRPNLVIIMLESWTADVVEPLDGEKDVTPFTNELVKESYLFTRCYGPGYRTDQGLVSILAGYPAQPDNSIIAYPSKTESLPSFCKALKKQDYASSFFYGGDIGFANMKSFIVQQGFDYISDKNNYDSKDYNSKWGAHDGKVLESQVNYLNKVRQPFLSGILTLSTHEPFEVPIQHKFPHDTAPNKFKNSAYYTDQCLKNYFAAAKKTSWYNNTLFLLVADHGHHLPRERNLDTPESKRITCIITGGALNSHLKGQSWKHVLGQQDLVKLLAPYFHVDPQVYRFAKNPFTTKHPFAYYANENVLGFITDSTNVVFTMPTGQAQGNTRLAHFAQAYLQQAYTDFAGR